MRVDQWCWARSIFREAAVWGFKGISNPRRGEKNAVAIVTSDERYMDDLHAQEAKYIAESDDWLEDWLDYVKRELHQEDRCPHGCPEEQSAFKAAFDRMSQDPDKRYAWASERVDWDWIHGSVKNVFESEEGIYYFLKEHPVDSVWQKYAEQWVDLDDVKGYCPSCDEALTEETAKTIPASSHFFDEHCEEGYCRESNSQCLFNHEGSLRKPYECPSCSWSDITEDVDGDETFVSKHGRPFNWPPGAPYPPRVSFTGLPMDVPPYED